MHIIFLLSSIGYLLAVYLDFDSFQALSAADRAGLYNDVFALADAALLNYTVALDFSSNLANESDYVPWNSVSTVLANMQGLLASTDAYSPFKVN